MYSDAISAGTTPAWRPNELGMPQATFMAIILVAFIASFIFYATQILVPPQQPQVIQVTQAQLVTLPTPKPPPPPPPKVVPPPKPIPAVIPKPPPIASKIVVATKPPPPIHHIYKPVHHVIQHVEQPPPPPTTQPPPATPTPPQPQVDYSSGLNAYGSQMHDIIQSNQDVPQALATLGASGTAVIQLTVAPDGHVISARIAHSSGIPLIDQTALEHAQQAHFPPFTSNMPNDSHTFIVPVEIDGENAQQ